MAYLEPGVYSKTVSTRANTGTGGPTLYPLVIGTGDDFVKRTEVITRGSGTTDKLPDKATSILSVGYTDKKADFTITTDYKIGTSDTSLIDWTPGTKKPAEGETYSVTFVSEAPASQYLPKLISGSQLSAYGSDIKIDGEINNIYTAANILSEGGVSNFIVLQVKPTGGTVTAADYKKALDNYVQFIEDVWRIVPADEGDDINAVIDGHVNSCSSYEERKERGAVYSKAGADKLTTSDQVLTSVGGLAKSKSNARISTVYPASATKVMSNGETRVLTGQFIAAAYAALEFTRPLYQSKTRSSIGVFKELLGVQLTRTEKNRLAECGVIIFEQPNGEGTNIICRHQLSTDMSSAETRENSILGCKDYTAKYLRNIVNTYVGKYNITADTITKVTGSTNSAFATLISEGYILDGSIVSLAQDENNPDTLILQVKIQVPYPCNYINITIMSE